MIDLNNLFQLTQNLQSIKLNINSFSLQAIFLLYNFCLRCPDYNSCNCFSISLQRSSLSGYGVTLVLK